MAWFRVHRAFESDAIADTTNTLGRPYDVAAAAPALTVPVILLTCECLAVSSRASMRSLTLCRTARTEVAQYFNIAFEAPTDDSSLQCVYGTTDFLLIEMILILI